MTTASASATQRVAVTGLRPLDPRRDLPEVVQLIEVGFREELDPLGLKMLGDCAARPPMAAGRSFSGAGP